MKTSSSQNASTLVTSMIVMVLISAAIGVAVSLTLNVAHNAQRSRAYNEGIAVGDAYLEYAFTEWRHTCRNSGHGVSPVSSDDLAYISSVSVPIPAPTSGSNSLVGGDFAYTVTNFKVQAVDAELNATSSSSDMPVAAAGQNGADKSFYYVASADVTMPVSSGPDVTVKVRRVFQQQSSSPWAYAIFYNDLLEIHPGQTMSVNGLVHTNGDMYLGSTGVNLKFTDQVTYSGNGAYNKYYDGRTQKLVSPIYAINPAYTARQDPMGITGDQFSQYPNNPNMSDGYREIIEPPDPNYPDPLKISTTGNTDNPRLYDNAAIKILIRPNGKLQVRDSSDNAVGSKSALYNAISAAVTTGQQIQDNREGATVNLTSLDVGKLKQAVDSNAIPNWNGVVYMADLRATTNESQDGTVVTQASSQVHSGFRLDNGSTLPNGGLTVVSENPVYIQGDYNTAKNRQPAAVLGDSVNILSNNWNDANSYQSLSSGKRNATSTTVNTAILSGIVPSAKAGGYSGGVENFPRFLENWSGKILTYNGSMVEMFRSQQSVGNWAYGGNIYNAPKRVWAFDPLFLTNPPPGTFYSVQLSKQRWFLQ